MARTTIVSGGGLMLNSLLLVSALASWACAKAPDSPLEIYRIEFETAERLQSGVLDPIFGKGRSSIFVSLTPSISIQDESTARTGSGSAIREMQKTNGEVLKSTASAQWDDEFTSFISSLEESYPGISTESARSALGTEGLRHLIRSGQTQDASQRKITSNSIATIERTYKKFRVVVLHDSRLSAKKIDDVRKAILSIYGPDLNSKGIVFHSAEFVEKP